MTMIRPGDCVECLTDPRGWGCVKAVDGDLVTAEFWVGFSYRIEAPASQFRVIPKTEDMAFPSVKK